MELKLRISSGKNAGQEIKVPGPKFVIGRAEGCQLRAKSDQIGERHCEFEVAPALVTVRDFGSPAGTLINGERVNGQRELKQGDKLKVGPLEFDVFVTTGIASKKKPKVGSVGEAATRMAAGPKADMDIDQWLSGDDEAEKPSKYALSAEELAALGLAEDGSKPADVPDDTAARQKAEKSASTNDQTRQAAADMINKYHKRS